MKCNSILSDKEIGEPTTEMFLALSQLISEVEPATPSGKHAHLGFRYLTEADLVSAIRGPFSRHGFGPPMPIEEIVYQEKVSQSHQGKDTWRTTIKVTYLLPHSSGGYLLLQSSGEAQDTQDKGTAKAQTSAFRQLLKRLGMIVEVTEDDMASITGVTVDGSIGGVQRRRPGDPLPVTSHGPSASVVPGNQAATPVRQTSLSGNENLPEGKQDVVEEIKVKRAIEDVERMLQRDYPPTSWDTVVGKCSENQLSWKILAATREGKGQKIDSGTIRMIIVQMNRKRDALLAEREKDAMAFESPF